MMHARPKTVYNFVRMLFSKHILSYAHGDVFPYFSNTMIRAENTDACF